MRLLCIFADELPKGAIVEVDGADPFTVTDVPSPWFVLDVDTSKIGKSKASHSLVWNAITGGVAAAAGAFSSQPAVGKDTRAWVRVRVASGQDEAIVRSWIVQWGQNETSVAFLLEAKNMETQILQSLDKTLDVVHSNDRGQNSLLFGSVLDRDLKVCVSAAGKGSERDRTIFDRVGDVMERFERRLAERGNWSARLMVASVRLYGSLSQETQIAIVRSAVDDLLEAKNFECFSEYVTNAYCHVQAPLWKNLAPASRLTIKVSLPDQPKAWRDIRVSNQAGAELKITGDIHSALARDRKCFELIGRLDGRSLKVPKDVSLSDPSIAVAGAVALVKKKSAGIPINVKDLNWELTWRGEAGVLSGAAVQVLNYLKSHLNNQPASEEFKTWVFRDLVPRIIGEMGLAEIHDAFQSFSFSLKELSVVALEHSVKEGQQMSISSWCEKFLDDLDNGISHVLAPLMLEYIIKEQNRHFLKPRDDQEVFLQALCQVDSAPKRAVRAVRMVMKHATADQTSHISRELKLGSCPVKAVDWIWCLENEHGTKVALQIAEHWFEDVRSIKVRSFRNEVWKDFADFELVPLFPQTRAFAESVSGEDIEDLKSICGFVGKVQNTELRGILQKLRGQLLWASRTVAILRKRSGDKVELLARSLRESKESIPTSFLGFLSASAEILQKGSFALAYRHLLLDGVSPSEVQIFLPAEDFGRKQRDRLKKLRKWLESFKVLIQGEKDWIETVAQGLDLVESGIKASQSSTFPECHRHDSTPEALQRILDAFDDDSMDSNFVKYHVRLVLKDERKKGNTDLWGALLAGREKAKSFLVKVFSGSSHPQKVTVKDVNLVSRSSGITILSSEAREAKSLRDLMLGGPVKEEQDDAFAIFVSLAHVKPEDVRDLALHLKMFFSESLGLKPAPKALEDFLKIYALCDLENLPVFGDAVPFKPTTLDNKCPSIKAQGSVASLCHMFFEFKGIMHPCAREQWDSIQFLHETGQLVKDLRQDESGGVDGKMDKLRILSITNGDLAAPVAALDGLVHHVQEVIKHKTLESIAELLPKLREAKINLNAGQDSGFEKSSLENLVELFKHTEDAQDVAQRNLGSLAEAKIVIKSSIFDNAADLYSSETPASSLFIECPRFKERMESCLPRRGAKCFQLGGGRACCDLDWQDSQDLMAEIVVQRTTHPLKEDKKTDLREDAVVEKARSRLKAAFLLAEAYHECASLGDSSYKQSFDSTGRMEFKTRAPREQGLRMYPNERLCAPGASAEDIHEIRSGKVLVQAEKLRTLFEATREQCPWISFCPAQLVMQRRKTPWLHRLAELQHTFAVESAEPANDVAKWCLEMQREKAKDSSFVEDVPIPKTSTLDPVSAVQVATDRVMLTALQALHAIGEWPFARATSLFPCDESALPSAIDGLVWRLSRAARLLTDSSGDEAQKHAISSLFLCNGLVIVRPELLLNAMQASILDAVDAYARATSKAVFKCPKVVMVLANDAAGEQFKSRMQARILLHSDLPEIAVGTFQNVQVFGTSVSEVAHGNRSSRRVPGDVYRILVGKDMSVLDLVKRVYSGLQADKGICLDLGSDASSVLKSPLAGALLSLFVCGVLGQAQHAAVALDPDQAIYVEMVHSTQGQLESSCLVNKTRNWDSQARRLSEGEQLKSEEPAEAFAELIEIAGHGRPVHDQHVLRALAKTFSPARDGRPVSTRESRMPFVHCTRSLRTMGLVAKRLRQCILDDRVTSGLPILISGDTGTGKTYVILKFVELLRCSEVIRSFDPDFLRIHTFSASFLRGHIEVIGEMMHKETVQSEKGVTRTIRPFVLDEITGSPAQEALSRLICFRERKDGSASETVLNRALIFASCNPETGRDSVFQMMRELEYASIKVEPLGGDERAMFVRSQLEDGMRGPGLTGKKLDRVAELVLKSMAAAESVPKHSRLGTTSLRDGVRCAALIRKLGTGWSSSGGRSFFDSLSCDSWLIEDETERIVVTACYLCFGMRIRPRSHFWDLLGSEKAPFLEQLKSAVLGSLAIPDTVVPTDAVKDNVLAVVVAISARLPLLCLGHDGTSKTLSLNVVVSQMRGQFSATPLLQGLPRVQTFNLQLSRASTAQHILALKKTVVGWNDVGTTSRHPCVCMEEISMAESGPSGPLRALHDLLDSHQETKARQKETNAQDVGTGCNEFSFIATSNYRTDCPSELPTGRALGNRMLILAHDAMPAEDLISLAVNSSLGEMREALPKDGSRDGETVRAVLERTVGRLCRAQEGRTGGCLVPDVISIRSLLYFCRALTKLLVANVPLGEAHARAFASHLQLPTAEKTEALWKRMVAVLSLSEEDRCYREMTCVIEDAFQHSRTRRPLLFLYNDLLEIHSVIELLKSQMKQDDEVRTICPGAFAMVDPNQSADENERIGLRESAVLHSMVQLRAMLKQGSTIVVLNPEPILQGIHALLNEPGAHTSQLQMKQSNESVVIHPDAQIVLLVQRTAVIGLHKALLSRVAVINNLTKEASSLPKPLIQLKKVYDDVPDVDEDSKWTEWREQEEEVLSNPDMSVEDLFKEMDMTQSRVLILLVPGPIPFRLLGPHKIDRVDAAVHVFQSDFASMVNSMIHTQEEAAQKEGGEGRILLLDLTEASPSGAIECMALLGLAGTPFEHESRARHGSRAMHDRLLTHAKNKRCRVVIALNNSEHPKLRVPRVQWKSKGNPRHVAHVIHMMHFFYPFPDWGSLSDIAEEPSTLFDTCKVELEGFLLRAVDAEGTSEFDSSARAKQLRQEIVDSALRYCFPKDAEKILFVTEQRGVNDREVHIARTVLFKSITTYLCKDRIGTHNVRVLLIRMCRHLCYKVGSQLLQKLPAHFFAQPKEVYVRFMAMLLKSGSLTWQRNSVTVEIGSEFLSQAHMTPSGRVGIRIPFLQDLLNSANRKAIQCMLEDSKEPDLRTLVSESIGLAFPTLANFSLGIEASDLSETPKSERLAFSRTLAESLMQICCGSDHAGRDCTIPCGWLQRKRWNGGTLGGMIGFFCQHRPWLEAASYIQMGQSAELFKKGAFEDEIMSVFRAVLEGKSGLNPLPGSERSLQLALEHAMLTCTSQKAKQTPEFKWLQQVMRMWAAFGDLSLAIGLVDPKVTIGEARKLIDPRICEPCALYTFLTVLKACDVVQCLPSATIAAAVFAADVSFEYAGSLLATAARLRKSSALSFLTEVTIHAFSKSLRSPENLEQGMGSAPTPRHISLCKETEIVAMAMCNLEYLGAQQLLDHVLHCEKELDESPGDSEKVHAYQALRLAAASAGVPKLAPKLNDSGCIDDDLMRVLEVFRPSSPPSEPSEVQLFLVRCLIASLGIGRFSCLSAWLPQVVGQWISPYLSDSEAPMSDLNIFFGLSMSSSVDEHDRGWPCALAKRLSGGSILNGEEIEFAVAQGDLIFCDQPAGAWCVMLQALAPSSVLASDAYRKESTLSSMTVPCSVPSPLEFKLLESMTLNECSCGYKYFIGNCGMPGSSRKCPDCQLMLGGEGHTHNPGQRKLDVGACAGVRDIDLQWFVPGVTHTERDLSPLAYRVLSVLLLIPLAMFSEKQGRVEQLERHWGALKDVTGLSSDQDVQHFLLGVLKNSHDLGNFKALACSEGNDGDFRSVQARNHCEASFMQALDLCLGFCSRNGIHGQCATVQSDLEGVRVAVRAFVDAVQDKYGRQLSCLAPLQEGKIARLPADEAAQKFAANILRLGWPQQHNESESLRKLRAHLVHYFANHALLTKVLFSSTSEDAVASIQSAHDLDEPEKLEKYFWQLFEGLARVHELARKGTSSVLDMSVRELLLKAGLGNVLESLSKAWNVCKMKHQVECQDVEDLGDIQLMPVSMVVWREEQDDKSRTETILNKLVDAHNKTVLLIKRGLKREGEDEEEELIRIKAGIKTVELTWETQADVFDRVVPKLRNARHWLEEHFDHLPKEPSNSPDDWQTMEKVAGDVQEIVRKLLDVQQLALFSLNSWRRIVRAPNSIVQVSPDKQASVIPQEAEKAFKEVFQRFGMQEDEVLKALEWAQRKAVFIDRAGGGVLQGTALSDLNGSCNDIPTLLIDALSAPSLSGQGKALQVKHINALQEYLARLLHKRPEDALPQANRVELPDQQAFVEAIRKLNQRELRVLFLKLELWCKTRASSSKAAWALCDCLASTEEVDGENLCDEDDWLDPLKRQELRNMHSYHALSAVRDLAARES